MTRQFNTIAIATVAFFAVVFGLTTATQAVFVNQGLLTNTSQILSGNTVAAANIFGSNFFPNTVSGGFTGTD